MFIAKKRLYHILLSIVCIDKRTDTASWLFVLRYLVIDILFIR
ncbi:hypothetical protein HMPREF0973_01311 [Prevotella veroralis F0319]|uniref:Uncharacterized protein n=1 Tax=Prevotella veroralis F0319 TaxID=649761 RepID=C9MNX3_9BACT|nr:hypothetical protein HMPREF0973_01311 [Prevotella veroralis F0319]